MTMLSLIKNIPTSLDSHKHAVGVFMNLGKAFDAIDHCIDRHIDHHILHIELCSYGIMGIVVKWIYCYLENV